MNQVQDSKNILYGAIFFSLLIHFVFGLSRIQKTTFNPISNQKDQGPKTIKVRLKKNQIKKFSESLKNMKKQIVSSELSTLKKKSIDTKFLSDKSQAVDRQTVARKIGSFQKAGIGNQGIKTKPSVKRKAKVKKRKGKGKKVSLADFSLNNARPALASRGLKNGDQLERGMASNNDYVEDIPLGDMTKLNTKEYKYYGFYFRIKQKLEQHWGKTLKEKAQALFRRGGRIPASESSITALVVSLNKQGQIVNIKLKGSSGVNELDAAAIESFNSAGPFPNPPEGMIKNGIAKIEWGFVVKS